MTVDERWDSFDCFIADMGRKPSPLHTLDRKDNAKPYCKENCRWATRQEQARNRDFLKKYRGRFVWEIAEDLGIKPMTFHHRLWRFNRGEIDETQLYKDMR